MRNMVLEVVVGLSRVSSELGVEGILIKCSNYFSFLCSPQRSRRSSPSSSTTDQFSSLCQQTHTSGHCPELTAVGEWPNVDWMINVNAFDHVNVLLFDTSLWLFQRADENRLKQRASRNHPRSPSSVYSLCCSWTPNTILSLRRKRVGHDGVFDTPAVEIVWLQTQSVTVFLQQQFDIDFVLLTLMFSVRSLSHHMMTRCHETRSVRLRRPSYVEHYCILLESSECLCGCIVLMLWSYKNSHHKSNSAGLVLMKCLKITITVY